MELVCKELWYCLFWLTESTRRVSEDGCEGRDPQCSFFIVGGSIRGVAGVGGICCGCLRMISLARQECFRRSSGKRRTSVGLQRY